MHRSLSDSRPRRFRRMPCFAQQRLERCAARRRLWRVFAVGSLAQVLAARVAENGGEKHVGVLAVGFEQKDVGIGILRTVSVHADFHPRVNDRTKGLREDHRQAAMSQLVEAIVSLHRARVEGHQRVDAEQQSARRHPGRREACRVLLSAPST